MMAESMTSAVEAIEVITPPPGRGSIGDKGWGNTDQRAEDLPDNKTGEKRRRGGKRADKWREGGEKEGKEKRREGERRGEKGERMG